jgi:hypothetical protein
MAIAFVVEMLKEELARAAPRYKELRADQHGQYHTDIILEKEWITEAMVYMVQDAAFKKTNDLDDLWTKAAVDQAMAMADTVYARRNIKQMATTMARNHIKGINPTQIFTSEKAWQRYVDRRFGGNEKWAVGVVISTDSKSVIVGFRNAYRFTEDIWSTTDDYTNNTNVFARKLVTRLAKELLAEIKKTSPRGASIQNLDRTGQDFENVDAPWQHHVGSELTPKTGQPAAGKTSGTVAETNFLAYLATNPKIQDGDTVGRTPPGMPKKYTTAQRAVEDALEAEFDVLTRDKKTGLLVSKVDRIRLKIGRPGKRDGDIDSKEIDEILDEISGKLQDAYAHDSTFQTSPKSPLENLEEVATAEAILKTTKGLRKSKNKNLKTKLNKKVTQYKKHNIKQKKIDAVGLLAAKKGARLLKKYVGKKVRPTKAMKSRVQTKAGTSPIALRTLLNTLLPRAVASKMVGGKTLQFRTGRFAGSAEVTNVTQGSRGGMNIDYTYMKYPYQTFEPGFAQGSTFRDPRLLIGQSIRELATQIMNQKFTGTVRRL